MLLAQNDGTFAPKVDYAAGTGPTSLVSADFNRDGRADVVVTNSSNGSLSVLLASAALGGFAAPVSYAVGGTTQAVIAADFNRDGFTDLATAVSSSGTVAVLLGNGQGQFPGRINYTVGSSPQGMVCTDLNGDTRLDLAVANSGGNSISVLFGTNSGTFSSQIAYPAGIGPISITSGDYNGDGRVDIAVGGNQTDIQILANTGNGVFAAPAAHPVNGGYHTSLITADFNSDGRPDLACTNQYSVNLSVLIGNGDGSFSPATHYGARFVPRALVSGDFNRDGKPDVAVVSEGINSGVCILLNQLPSVPPNVTSSSFSCETGPKVSFAFSVPMDAASIAASDLVITNTSLGLSSSPVSVAMVGDRVATFVLPTGLAKGNYSFVLPAGSVAAVSGGLLSSSAMLENASTFILPGDANRDRGVDFDDLLVLASNYNSVGKGLSEGNLNYSAGGEVDFSDLLILAANYNDSLSSAPAAPLRVSDPPSVPGSTRSRGRPIDVLND